MYIYRICNLGTKNPGELTPGSVLILFVKLIRMLGLQLRSLIDSLPHCLVMMLCLLAQRNRNES